MTNPIRTAFASPAFAAADGSRIDVMLTTAEFGAIPFTADLNDCTPYGAAIHAAILAGAGSVPIAAYVAPAYPKVLAKVGTPPREIG